MDEYTLIRQIAAKKVKIENYKALRDGPVFLRVLFPFLISAAFIAFAIFLLCNSIYLAGYLILNLGFVVFIATIVLFIVFRSRKMNAQNNISILESQIRVLKSQLDGLKKERVKSNPSSEIDNLNLLLKYKELLDKKVISQQEYDAKKAQLLKE